MASLSCRRCGQVTETLTASGLCTVCESETAITRQIGTDAPTVTRDPADTLTHAGTTDWAGILPAGGYRYEEELGEGGMGVVWRVVRLSTGEVLAVKKLRQESYTPAGIRRFVAEAKSLAAVKHDHVVRLYDFVPDPADPYLVLEFVPGQSLARHVKEVGPLHPRRAARMIADAARGVQAAHDKGIIHRDLKPGNLLLTQDGKVKVADFGLCKVTAEAEVLAAVTTSGGSDALSSDSTLTATGKLAGGTPGFMAPEQVSEEYGVVGPTTDVWGLGACLHTALTGQPPFPGGKSNMARVLTDDFIPPHQADPRVPVELSDVVMKCLRKNQAERYPSAAAVADDLERYLAEDGTSVRPLPWYRRAWRQVRRAPLGVKVATGVAVLAVAIGITLAMVPKQPKDPLTLAQKKLQANVEVVLVDDGKFLLKPQWLAGDSVLMEPTAEQPYSSFASAAREVTMLTLMDDPGVECYRISARIRQLAAMPDSDEVKESGEASVGVFWGYRETGRSDGGKARAFMALRYGDVQPNPNKIRTKHLAHYNIGYIERPFLGDQARHPTTLMGPNFALEHVPQLPGPWRDLTVDVASDVVTLHFPNGPKTLGAETLTKNVQDLEQSMAQIADKQAPGLQNWSPRSPVGVFVDRSRVAIERFVITPLSPK